MNTDARRGLLALVLVTALWGITFPLVGGAVSGRAAGPIVLFLALRFGLATLAFLPIAGAIRRAARGRGIGPWRDALLVGALLFGGFALQTLGLVHTSPARSAFITMAAVIFVPFLAALEHRRRPSRAHVLGCLGALLGLAFVMSPGGEFRPNLGDLLTFGCALLFAVHIVALERVTRRSPTLPLAVGQIATVALLSLVLLPFVGLEWPDPWPGLWPAVGVTGILCTSLALGLMVFGQARVPAEVAAVIFALEPIWAALFEALYLGTSLGRGQWAAGALVVCSVAWASRAPVPSSARASRAPGPGDGVATGGSHGGAP